MSEMIRAGQITPDMYGNKKATIVQRNTTISGPLFRTDFTVNVKRNIRVGEHAGDWDVDQIVTPTLSITIGPHEVKNVKLDHPVIIKDRDD